MKQPSFCKSRYRSLGAILLVALMAGTAPVNAGVIPAHPDAVVVTKQLTSRKHKVRLFTASDAQTVLFSVDGVADSQYTLFVFDLEGKLIAQSAIRNHQTSILPELRSGGYLYEVFCGRSESGERIADRQKKLNAKPISGGKIGKIRISEG
jgi:hypothetical protein